MSSVRTASGGSPYPSGSTLYTDFSYDGTGLLRPPPRALLAEDRTAMDGHSGKSTSQYGRYHRFPRNSVAWSSTVPSDDGTAKAPMTVTVRSGPGRSYAASKRSKVWKGKHSGRTASTRVTGEDRKTGDSFTGGNAANASTAGWGSLLPSVKDVAIGVGCATAVIAASRMWQPYGIEVPVSEFEQSCRSMVSEYASSIGTGISNAFSYGREHLGYNASTEGLSAALSDMRHTAGQIDVGSAVSGMASAVKGWGGDLISGASSYWPGR